VIGSLSRSLSVALPMVANHLWQSTVCLALVALLTWTLRNNQAHVRHRLWLAASIKFLIPFAPLVAIGRQFAWHAPAAGQPAMLLLVDTMSPPFSGVFHAATVSLAHSRPLAVWVSAPMLLLSLWLVGCAAVLLTWFAEWRRVATTVRGEQPMCEGREMTVLRRLQRIGGLETPISIIPSPTSFEPGVFGIAKPMVLWPQDLSERLDDDQLEAILAHEVCHVWRRDNLTVAIHMVVEVVFWFHPLVWWVERRLVEEREQACDEAVIRWGISPPVYAEGILKTCEFRLASPLLHVCGATDSDLNARIEAIMNTRPRDTLHGWRKVLLATTGVIAMAAPVAVGALSTPQLTAQSAAPITATAQASPDAQGQAPAPLTAFDAASHRLVTLLFDVRSVMPEDVTKAADAAERWVNEKMAAADLVAVATRGSSLQVLTGFTSSKAEVTAALCAFSAAATGYVAAVDANTSASDWFDSADRLRALAARPVTSPPKNAILYYSAGIKSGGPDLQVELRAAVFAAVGGNVAMYPMSIYPVDSRSLPAIVPGDSAGAACAPPK
jgi:beta-lactamase regulating signal transducer with metallopeptidase domain